jgi:deoxyribose-phosphate aldolase
MTVWTVEALARLIDHTNLTADATDADISRLCDEALEFGCAAVCVNPCRVTACATRLAGSPVRVCTVAGFPLGANVMATKIAEAQRALADGAGEIDVVINIGRLKSGDHGAVEDELAAVVQACRAAGAVSKAILELAALTDDEKVRACELAVAAGADYVKTSTGFGRGGATVEDVSLMRAVAGPAMGIKAAGGIRTREAAEALLAAGATRLGTSATRQIAGVR